MAGHGQVAGGTEGPGRRPEIVRSCDPRAAIPHRLLLRTGRSGTGRAELERPDRYRRATDQVERLRLPRSLPPLRDWVLPIGEPRPRRGARASRREAGREPAVPEAP